MEWDPEYAGASQITLTSPPYGISGTFNEDFLYEGVRNRGTGRAYDTHGTYIQWAGGNFAYGMGGAYSTPRAWKTVAARHPRLTRGVKIVMESYRNGEVFEVADYGGDTYGDDGVHGIDIFVGEIFHQGVLNFGAKFSKVGIKIKS